MVHENGHMDNVDFFQNIEERFTNVEDRNFTTPAYGEPLLA
jgi:hypothetical protein